MVQYSASHGLESLLPRTKEETVQTPGTACTATKLMLKDRTEAIVWEQKEVFIIQRNRYNDATTVPLTAFSKHHYKTASVSRFVPCRQQPH